LDRQLQSKGQHLILHVDQDSATAIKETSYKDFSGLAEGTFNVLSDPDEDM
jgi:hypothetical protein